MYLRCILFRMFNEASSAGDPDAQGHLAAMYQLGVGVKKDLQTAAK